MFLESSVYWNPKAVTAVTDLHSGKRDISAGTLPADIPHPTYITTASDLTNMNIGGTDAYLLSDNPVPVTALSPKSRQLSALKNGYVVYLESNGLTRSQEGQAMKAILGPLWAHN